MAPPQAVEILRLALGCVSGLKSLGAAHEELSALNFRSGSVWQRQVDR